MPYTVTDDGFFTHRRTPPEAGSSILRSCGLNPFKEVREPPDGLGRVLVQISDSRQHGDCELWNNGQEARTAAQISGAVADLVASFPVLN